MESYGVVYDRETDRVPVSEMDIESAPGDSQEQQEAEDLMIGLLGKSLGLALVKKRFELPAGGWLEIDGYCDSPRILCEAWAISENRGLPRRIKSWPMP
jgi:hypothetical protein